MWRSVIIYTGDRLSLRDDWLVVEYGDGGRKELPLSDLYCIVLDNQQSSVSIPLLTKLIQFQVHLITTDERHMPIAELLPLNTHYKCYRVIKQQIAMTELEKGKIWQKIINAKIKNQAIVMANTGAEEEQVQRMTELSEQVEMHDTSNREAVAAKIFFRDLYGAEFIRFTDDKINAGLNYGYAIIRSSVAKALVSYGFSCVIGIHHISETNGFNLADDFMEPFRPLVDDWVFRNIAALEEGLTRDNKSQLVNLVNSDILFDQKVVKVRYAFDMMIRSFVTAVESGNTDRIILPEILSKSYD